MKVITPLFLIPFVSGSDFPKKFATPFLQNHINHTTAASGFFLHTGDATAPKSLLLGSICYCCKHLVETSAAYSSRFLTFILNNSYQTYTKVILLIKKLGDLYHVTVGYIITEGCTYVCMDEGKSIFHHSVWRLFNILILWKRDVYRLDYQSLKVSHHDHVT